jgi:hypothetical protein
MATCDTQTLLTDGSCFACLTGNEQELAELALLAEMTGVSDTQTLITNGNCFACLSNTERETVELQLLCEALQA